MNAREKILLAFRELVLSVPYDELKTHEVISRAGVARSTFYAHFRDRNELLLASLGPILAVLGASCRGGADPAVLTETLTHVWENRAIGRIFFRAPIAERLTREMVRMLQWDKVDPTRCHFLANGLLGMLGAWTTGQLALTPAELAEAVLRLTSTGVDPESARQSNGDRAASRRAWQRP